MAWYDEDSWATAAFAPNVSTIAFTLFLVLVLPILLHQFLYKRATPTTVPAFLLVGPSGAGKTALLTLAERAPSSPARTHTSTAPLTIRALLPDTYTPNSTSYRSAGDPAHERARNFLLHDTPGHGKLRHFASSQIVDASNIRGIIFMVDSAAIAEEAGRNEAAEYLHDVLLALQKKYTSAKTSKVKEIPVLVAANKMDLFTSLPAHLVRLELEKGVSDVRDSRAKGLKDSGVVLDGGDDTVLEEEKEWLGEGGEGKWEFGQMEEVGVSVVVKGGSVIGGEGLDVNGWWEWIAEQL